MVGPAIRLDGFVGCACGYIIMDANLEKDWLTEQCHAGNLGPAVPTPWRAVLAPTDKRRSGQCEIADADPRAKIGMDWRA